jgi:hypothetical protein
MLDVHTLTRKIHGLKDFLLHIFTITVGLLIALSLEHLVETRHHRHLVHQADAALHTEIEANAKTVAVIRQQIKTTTDVLDKDLATLALLRKNPDTQNESLHFEFNIRGFDDAAWKTTQTAGTFVYMPYEDTSEFSSIYGFQGDVYKVQQQAVNDILSAAALPVTKAKGEKPTPAEIDTMVDRIGLAKMRLIFLDSLVDGLDKTYKQYQAGHP